MIDLELLKRMAGLLRPLESAADGAMAAGHYAAISGNFGELIAAGVFPVALHDDARHPGSDGFFADGRYGAKCLRGRTVEVKRYANHPGYLDLKPTPPDYYLVINGPKAGEKPSGPWAIEYVFLFDGYRLHHDLEEAGVKIAEPTPIPVEFWNAAEIFPRSNPDYPLGAEQRAALELFPAP